MAYTSKHPHTKELRDPEVTANMLLELRDYLYDVAQDKSMFGIELEILLKINSCLFISKREQCTKINT